MATNHNGTRDNNQQPLATGSIIDVIHEKTANIEQSINSTNIRGKIEESIKMIGKRERILRISTITIKITSEVTMEKVTELIAKEWTHDLQQVSPTLWQDKEHIYCQFSTQAKKNSFLHVIEGDHLIKRNLAPEVKEGQHFERKMVKLEMPNVFSNIESKKLRELINHTASNTCTFTDMKEGKLHTNNRKRAITFKTNAEGLKHIILTLDGAIPYIDTVSKARNRIQIRINCRPWICKDCFIIGQHQCLGKICGNCGEKQHQTRECSSKTKYCSNCKKRGHRARDTHCMTYLNEAMKELRKMDIPTEFYEKKELRSLLISILRIK